MRMWRSSRWALGLVFVLSVGAGNLTQSAPATATHAATPLARVAYVLRGLAVQPAHSASRRAPVGTPVYDAYAADTLAQQKASFRFGDQTTLLLNERTSVLFRSPSETDLHHGEIAQYLSPGASHRVVTPAAVASAIGTTIDVYIHSDDSTFVVLEGALQVANPQGSVVVKTNEETTVGPGEKPSPPRPVNAAAVFDWTTSIPKPVLGQNIGLDANGGRIVGVSSQAPGATWAAGHVNDGSLIDGWATADGQTANQWVKIGFAGGGHYRVSGVVLDAAATHADSADEDLRHFDILVSTTGTAASDFRTVFSGTCRQAPGLQRFVFAGSVVAKYVELRARDNYGSTRRLTVAELEVVATAPGFNDPQGLALDPLGTLYVADTGNDRIQKVSPRGKTLAVWGSKGSGPGQFRRPFAVALDARGRIYVADSGNHRIDAFSAPGRLLRSWGAGSGLLTPTTVASGGGNRVYVGDLSGHRILVFTSDGRRVATIRIPGAAGGGCGSPAALAEAPDRSVWDMYYVSAGVGRFGLRLERRSGQGRIMKSWSLTGSTPVCSATGIAFSASAPTLWVTLPASNRVAAFSFAGTSLSHFGGPGSRPGRFLQPSGIGVGRQGAVWVVDSGNDRIQKLTAAGRPLAQLG